jgi:hypothetical protein
MSQCSHTGRLCQRCCFSTATCWRFIQLGRPLPETSLARGAHPRRSPCGTGPSGGRPFVASAPPVWHRPAHLRSAAMARQGSGSSPARLVGTHGQGRRGPRLADCRRPGMSSIAWAKPAKGLWHDKAGAATGPAPPCNQASLNGSSRSGLPVRRAMAFAKAGASGGRPGSPTPVGASALGTMCTAIAGMSVIRATT